MVYLNPTLACHTKASKKNKIGIAGNTSTSGLNTAKAPGNLLNNNVSIYFIVKDIYFLDIIGIN
jgi:hypothetical protein